MSVRPPHFLRPIRVKFGMLIWLCAIVLPQTISAAEPARLLDGFRQDEIVMENSGFLCLRIHIYLAVTGNEQTQGLMRIEKMDEFEGMLFVHERPRIIGMWMKNTYIPLDMVFMHRDGTVSSIAARTTPMSTKSIRSSEPVSFVLELNGGFAERWDVEPGSRMHWAAL